MSVKQRIIEFAKTQERSVRAFEIKAGLTVGYINAIRVSIQPDKLKCIASHYPNLNTGWLLTGEGEMLKNITEMSEGSLPAASEHPSMTSSQKGKVPENVFTGLTQEQVDKEMKNGIRDVIMEMYEKGEAYPATIVRQYQDQIKELTKQVARLEYQLQESGLKQTVSAGSLGRTGNREREDESDK